MKQETKNKIKKIKFVMNLYRFIKEGKLPPFTKPSFFLNNSNNAETACFILAGYKEFTWEIVFKRIKLFCPKNIDVCIVSSGVYSNVLKKYAEANNWSYVSIKRNCVTLALNSAINLFKNAKKIFKLDEDIFITEGFFEELPIALEEAKKDYNPAFAAPLIPINGYGYRKILEILNLQDYYFHRYEYPKISAGTFMEIEKNPEVAKFFWGKTNEVPKIDELNKIVKSRDSQIKYSICPIRFSIGAIFLERELLEKYNYLPVKRGNCMGLDEEFLCNLSTTDSKVIVVSERQVIGHLSFGNQNSYMKDYYICNKDKFDI